MKPKKYKQRLIEYHENTMWGRFVKWLNRKSKKKLKGGQRKNGLELTNR